jgi:hypothetical protein
MKSAGKTIGILVALTLVAGVGWQMGWFDGTGTANLGQNTIPTIGQTTTTTGVQDYKGNLNLSTETFDSLDSTNSGLGDDTELDTICYERIGDDVSDWIEIGVVSEAETGDANVEVDGQSEMWCELNHESSQEYYVDAEKTVAKNKRIDTFIWDDANGDNDDTYIFRVNLLDITPSTDGEAVMTLNFYLYDEDTSDSLIDTATADKGGVATGETNTIVQYNIDLDSSSTGGDAKYIHTMRIKINSTDDTLWVDSDSFIALPDGSKLYLVDMSRNDLASTTEYKHIFPSGNDYSEAYALVVDKDASTELDFPLTMRTAFSSADGLCIEMGVRYINPFGTVSSYDAVDVGVMNGVGGTSCSV